MEEDDIMGDFDPYDQLMELTAFCNSADEHIMSLVQNQTLIVNTINDLREDMNEASELIKKLVEHLNDL